MIGAVHALCENAPQVFLPPAVLLPPLRSSSDVRSSLVAKSQQKQRETASSDGVGTGWEVSRQLGSGSSGNQGHESLLKSLEAGRDNRCNHRHIFKSGQIRSAVAENLRKTLHYT